MLELKDVSKMVGMKTFAFVLAFIGFISAGKCILFTLRSQHVGTVLKSTFNYNVSYIQNDLFDLSVWFRD